MGSPILQGEQQQPRFGSEPCTTPASPVCGAGGLTWARWMTALPTIPTNKSKLRRTIFILLGTPEFGWVRMTPLKGRTILHGHTMVARQRALHGTGLQVEGSRSGCLAQPLWPSLVIVYPVPRLAWSPLPSLHHQQLWTPLLLEPRVLWAFIISGQDLGVPCSRAGQIPWGCPGSGALPHALIIPNPACCSPAQPHFPGLLPAPKPISSSSETLLPPL